MTTQDKNTTNYHIYEVSDCDYCDTTLRSVPIIITNNVLFTQYWYCCERCKYDHERELRKDFLRRERDSNSR